jgi:hypothetical protein
MRPNRIGTGDPNGRLIEDGSDSVSWEGTAIPDFHSFLNDDNKFDFDLTWRRVAPPHHTVTSHFTGRVAWAGHNAGIARGHAVDNEGAEVTWTSIQNFTLPTIKGNDAKLYEEPGGTSSAICLAAGRSHYLGAKEHGYISLRLTTSAVVTGWVEEQFFEI